MTKTLRTVKKVFVAIVGISLAAITGSIIRNHYVPTTVIQKIILFFGVLAASGMAGNAGRKWAEREFDDYYIAGQEFMSFFENA